MQSEASVINGVLQVTVPVAFLEDAIDAIVSANGGRYEDTEDRRLDVNEMRAYFTEEGLVINGKWYFQFRECLSSLLGNKQYTPWVAIGGTFCQDFSIKIGNGRLFAEASHIEIQGAYKWYPEILYSLISRFRINGLINKLINQELQNFKGMNLQQLLVQAGSDSVARLL
ncbi:MAG: hypothetical protein ACRC62_33675, partial [Microcoleus sp.]